ncbi:CDP-diacylglycerol--glycerol-3-phosphate 3-phosphatidyltransferase [Mesoterricola silvestris]|uniref:CDP-diacylglycerol--glycerol-3-phosphate 3-phosphatidyltransferase n=1 Tax=Mesoterricola silvestris TaxID=2927979 RepID=A0AA48KB99_9BACT|nr:CDP-diacylglycerol--glycerol-3-phosphate 3-phosphatidyltransferase [Mesoterricola silvestris]BDU72308.1 CDP-diacylglycerol--glycerol-3-phosphate 3-phosphatidyltransferase [Mesoterricola silvestris]
MTVPNYLTLARILMVPILVVVLLTRVTNHEIIGVLVFWAASLTDLLDGYLARKWGQVTTLGKLLDPLADKLLIMGALISLVELDMAPAWMTFIILGREMAITGLRGIASEEGVTIAAERLGKWKLGFQIASISCLLLGPKLDLWLLEWTHLGIFRFFIRFPRPYSFFWGMGVLLLWVAMILSVWSAVTYFRKFWHKLGHSLLTGHGRLSAHESPDRIG